MGGWVGRRVVVIVRLGHPRNLCPSRRRRCLGRGWKGSLSLVGLSDDDGEARWALVFAFVLRRRGKFVLELRWNVLGPEDQYFSHRMQRIHPNCCPLSSVIAFQWTIRELSGDLNGSVFAPPAICLSITLSLNLGGVILIPATTPALKFVLCSLGVFPWP